MDAPEDVWARVTEAPSYEVNKIAQVRNKGTGKILKPQLNSTGVQQVSLREGHQTITRSVNALRKRAFGNSS